MTASVSQRLDIISITFKSIAFFIITLFVWLYVSVGVLLTGMWKAPHQFTKRRGLGPYKS